MERGRKMDQRQRTRRFGLYVILCALLLRLSAAGAPQKLLQWMTAEEQLPFLIYLETGRNVRFSDSMEKYFEFFRESPPPVEEQTKKPVFREEDMEMVEIYDSSGLHPETAGLITSPLCWDLEASEPAVLILHTHATESYTKAGEDYEESSAYRTLEAEYNMLSIGDAVAKVLEDAGIGVIHDRQLHDYPSYNGSYVHARHTISETLEQYPDIRLVLDLHRDAAGDGRNQLRTEAAVKGAPSAQLMFVVGTNASGQSHDHWQDNLSLALKLQVQLERQAPGITRPLNLRRQRFNQDLSPGALLVEVGAAGNTRAEALTAARQLAEAIVALSGGVQTE